MPHVRDGEGWEVTYEQALDAVKINIELLIKRDAQWSAYAAKLEAEIAELKKKVSGPIAADKEYD